MGKKLTKQQRKILKTAQQGEVDAVFMYKRLARVVENPEDQKAFIRLSGDEARHAAVFYKYTGRSRITNPAKGILIPIMYKFLGKEKLYPMIAKGEYDAAEKYKAIISDFPDVEDVMNDEVHHGDAVSSLLK